MYHPSEWAARHQPISCSEELVSVSSLPSASVHESHLALDLAPTFSSEMPSPVVLR